VLPGCPACPPIFFPFFQRKLLPFFACLWLESGFTLLQLFFASRSTRAIPIHQPAYTPRIEALYPFVAYQRPFETRLLTTLRGNSYIINLHVFKSFRFNTIIPIPDSG
jgi:hypothetical protein